MLRRTPLATKNLTHNLPRTIVSIGGVMLAVVLMFMQLGFLGAVGDTATVVYQRMPMDVVVRSPDYLHLFEADSVDERVGDLLRGLPEVERVIPLDASLAAWRNPRTRETRSIATLGITPESPGVLTDELRERVERLTSPAFVLVDRESGPEFVPTASNSQPNNSQLNRGPNPNADLRFSDAHLWSTAEVNGLRVRIVETFQLGTGLAAAGAMIVSRDGFRRLQRGQHDGRASLLLIQTPNGVSPAQAQQAIQARLDALGWGSLQVRTRNEAFRQEIQRWYFETPIGMIFMMGVGLAVVVGSVICYMVLSTEVMANLAEYATLKAMGYPNRFLGGVLLRQSAWIAALAFLPATLFAQILYVLTSRIADIPIEMTAMRVLLVAVLSLVMCMVAGLVALKKLAKAEPASLF